MAASKDSDYKCELCGEQVTIVYQLKKYNKKNVVTGANWVCEKCFHNNRKKD